MRWNHLPVGGGLYDQHPRLLDEWRIIFNAKADHERDEAEKRARESNKPNAKPRGGRRGRKR